MKIHKYYEKIHYWKTIAFVAKEWILRDNIDFIVKDLKYLTKIWINIILYHNIQNNKWNNKFLKENITDKVSLKLVRISSNKDFYSQILDTKLKIDKLIFLEKQYLLSKDKKKINTIRVSDIIEKSWNKDIKPTDLDIANINFLNHILKIFNSIISWNINRVHILPWWEKNAIKNELLSIEWVWTLIWYSFWKPDIKKAFKWSENIIFWILTNHKNNNFIKPRSLSYIKDNIENFYIAYIDGIAVWCVEKIDINNYTIELWALAVIENFLDFKIWKSLIWMIENIAEKDKKVLISLTNNPKLKCIYKKRWFKKDNNWLFKERSEKSPWVELYYKFLSYK